MKISLPIIVGLTSIRSRLEDASLAVESILDQSIKADQIVLWLSEEPHLLDDGVTEIPPSLKKLIDRGLKIRWTENIGPYRKLIATAKLMNRKDCLLVTADDNVIYPKNWLKGLKEAYEKHEGCVICYNGKIISKADRLDRFFTKYSLKPYTKWIKTEEVEDDAKLGPSLDVFPIGKEGVLYPSKLLHEELFNKSIYMKMAPDNDDVWFKAITMITRTKVKCIAGHVAFAEVKNGKRAVRIDQKNRTSDEAIKKIFGRYNLI